MRLIGAGSELGSEQALRDNARGHVDHLQVHIEGLAVLPVVDQARGVLDHDRGIAGDGLLAEGRLHDLAVLRPGRPLADQQSIAQGGTRQAQGEMLAEAAALADQDLADPLRMANQQGAPG